MIESQYKIFLHKQYIVIKLVFICIGAFNIRQHSNTSSSVLKESTSTALIYFLQLQPDYICRARGYVFDNPETDREKERGNDLYI